MVPENVLLIIYDLFRIKENILFFCIISGTVTVINEKFKHYLIRYISKNIVSLKENRL